MGGLNAVTHLWEYQDLEHRAQIRANLAADPIWISDYVTHLTPMLQAQANSGIVENQLVLQGVTNYYTLINVIIPNISNKSKW